MSEQAPFSPQAFSRMLTDAIREAKKRRDQRIWLKVLGGPYVSLGETRETRPASGTIIHVEYNTEGQHVEH